MSYDLDHSDTLWAAQRGKPFPVVAAAIEEALATYKEREKKIKDLRGTGVAGDSDGAVASAIADNTSRLNSAVSSLGDMLEQKKLLDMHTNLMTEILDALKARQLDVFYEIEEEILQKKKPSKSILEVITQHGEAADKLRLYLM